MRLVWMAVLAASLGWAQFAEFAAPGNGSKLYFSSSLPLQGSGEPAQGRIFSVDASGVHTVADVPATAPSPTTNIYLFLTSFYQLSRPELSRDGTILIYTGQRGCYGTDNCSSYIGTDSQTTVIGVPGGLVNYNGSGRISGNGRYLLLAGKSASVGPATSVLDLQTGQSQTLTPFSPAPDGLGRVVADDGTVVYDDGDLYIAKGAAVQTIQSPGFYAQQAVIDASAQTVIYVQWVYGTNLRTIHAYSISQKTDLAIYTQGDNTAPYITADGTQAMFISTASGSPQIWVVNTDATGARQVTSDSAGVILAAMSDDGTTAWYLSNSGQVMQVDLNSGAAQERIGRTPSWTRSTPIVTPGTALTIEGTGLSDSTFTAQGYPLPQSLGGVTVSIGGIGAPILSVAPRQIVVEAPWEIPVVGSSVTSMDVIVNPAASTSPFVPTLTSSVSAWRGWGAFVRGPSGIYTLAAHQDWSAPVTRFNPALPNEILHLFGFGFGPVDSHPPDGMPASANPLSRTLTPIACTALGADNVTELNIPVLFSGLAPGLVGYYQLDIQLPPSNLRSNTGIECTGAGLPGGFGGNIPVNIDPQHVPRRP